MNLSHFEKPSRYIDGELHALYKNAPLKVALAFPDIYDVGMSHLGLRILYKIINDLPFASAERVFSPWLDMEAEMRAKGIPLMSLETKRPLRDFDIIGFSLQYELSYTTVLAMLSLSGIPVRSEERDRTHPLIIAGGPSAVNPLPMSPFIDAFLIGDGEEAIKEIIGVCYRWKHDGDRKRASLLRGLSEIEGMYVPSLHGVKTGQYYPAVKRRYIESLDDAPFPVAPVVPYTSIVHDRINIEVSRGCSMGCRFCQAGMIYRPLRERSPEKVMQIAEDSLRNTGYEDISLTSLSAGDYSCLLPLVREMNRVFSKKVVSLSLPSLRVGSVSQEVLQAIRMVRKTGFTMAPEAATERLRAVVNKDFDEQDYERALHALFGEGWENIKLYFMVGLPTEKDEDIEAIPDMALKAIKVAKKYTRRFINVNVGVSPFVPKPHTPFQWYGQEDIKKIKEKMGYLKQNLTKKGMNFKGHALEMSLLEAVFARGDEQLSDLIEKAWSLGCRLDAWTEAFDFGKWLRAADAAGIDLYRSAGRGIDKGEALPWEGIDMGIQKDFMWKEYQKALSGETTEDCKKRCHGCGLTCSEFRGQMSDEGVQVGDGNADAVCFNRPTPGSHPGMPGRKILPFTRSVRVRVQFSKTGTLKYLSHRELMTAMIRALRRTEIPVLYSQGFHPAPKVSFGPPLSVGMSGLKEYLDIEIEPGYGTTDIVRDLNLQLPQGIRAERASPVLPDQPSLQSFISRYEYEIISPGITVNEELLRSGSWKVTRERQKGNSVQVDIRRMVEQVKVVNRTTVRLVLKDLPDCNVRPGEIMKALFGKPAEELDITRLSLYGWNGEWSEPLEATEDVRYTMQGAVTLDASRAVPDKGMQHASGIVHQELEDYVQ